VTIDATLLAPALGGTHSVGMADLGALLTSHLGASIDYMSKVTTVDALGRERLRCGGHSLLANRSMIN